MNLTDALSNVQDILDEAIAEPALDTGQRQMLAEAQVRVSQVNHELHEFAETAVPEDYDDDIEDGDLVGFLVHDPDADRAW